MTHNHSSLAPATPPTNVMAIATSPRSITVMWEEVVPIDQNGVITMYQVLYQPLETFGGAIGPLTVNVTELTADLTDLDEYVNYTISVRAYTSAGEGPYSDGVTVITLEDGKLKHASPPCIWYALIFQPLPVLPPMLLQQWCPLLPSWLPGTWSLS